MPPRRYPTRSGSSSKGAGGAKKGGGAEGGGGPERERLLESHAARSDARGSSGASAIPNVVRVAKLPGSRMRCGEQSGSLVVPRAR